MAAGMRGISTGVPCIAVGTARCSAIGSKRVVGMPWLVHVRLGPVVQPGQASNTSNTSSNPY
jgi:hypothetical protein